jgi:hypothetical protein
MSSYIKSAGAEVTRPADSLQYNGDNVTAGQGAFVADCLWDDHDLPSTVYAFVASDGTSNNRTASFINSSDNPVWFGADGGVAQWNIAGSTDMIDGETPEKHTRFAERGLSTIQNST